MPESSLAITVGELKRRIANFIGVGTSLSALSQADSDLVDWAYRDGLRKVLVGSPVGSSLAPHQWSWLMNSMTITTSANMWQYDLPDDFDSLIGDLFYRTQIAYGPIKIVTQQKLLSHRQASAFGPPCIACVAGRFPPGASESQRWKIQFFPTPSDSYSIDVNYQIVMPSPSETGSYLPGGPACVEMFIEACLSSAESRVNDEIGMHGQLFLAEFQKAVLHDRGPRGPRLISTPRFQNDTLNARPSYAQDHYVTYNGAL